MLFHRYPTPSLPGLWKHHQPKGHTTQLCNTKSRETSRFIPNSYTGIACSFLLFFSHFLLFLLCSASPISQDISVTAPAQQYLWWLIMSVHLSWQQIWAGHFPKGKTMEAIFTAGAPISPQANTAPASPCVDWAGRDGFVLLCQTCCFQKPLAVSGGGHSWIQSSLLLRFLQELHTASILIVSGLVLLYHSFLCHTSIYPNHCRIQPSFCVTLHFTAFSHCHKM